jgi:DeoR/GlpR family transcriptional regulator of sugar metabolism
MESRSVNVGLDERLARIERLLQSEPFMTVKGLSGALNVSTMTIRRDLDRLAERGTVVRVHGGVMVREKEAPVGEREKTRMVQKEAIARRALLFIQPGETIVVDSGTTAAALARALLTHPVRPLTVVTHALNVATILLEDSSLHVSVTGGDLRAGTASLVGPVTRAFYESIRADLAFVTAVGVTEDEGFSNSNFAEAEIKTTIRSRANRVLALIDASKCGVRSMVSFAPIDGVDQIVTDWEIDPTWEARFRAHGVHVTMAEPPSEKGSDWADVPLS